MEFLSTCLFFLWSQKNDTVSWFSTFFQQEFAHISVAYLLRNMPPYKEFSSVFQSVLSHSSDPDYFCRNQILNNIKTFC